MTPTPTPNYQSGYPQTGNPGNGSQGINSQPGTTQQGSYINQPTGGGMPGAITGPNAPAGTSTGSDPCYGDEQITFAPEQPRVNNEVLIAVTSSRT